MAEERSLLIRILGDAKHFIGATDEAGNATEGLSGRFKGLMGVAAGALSVGAVVGFAHEAVGAFESVGKATLELQRLTGGTAESMSRLRFAAEESGVSTDQLEGGIRKLSKSLAGANETEQKQIVTLNAKGEALDRQRDALEKVANPTDAQRQKLEDLTKAIADNDDKLSELGQGLDKYGIAMKDAQGNTRPMHDILLDVADKFKSMPDGIDKNTLAIKLFGKSGTDLLPFLNRGAEGISELEKESDKFGLTIGQKNVDDIKKNVMAHREMHAAIEGLKVQIGEQLMPIITTLSVWMAQHLPQAIAAVRAEFEVLRPHIQAIGLFLQENFLPVIQQVWGFLENHHAILIAVGVAIFALVAPMAAVVVGLVALVAGLVYAWNNFTTFRTIVTTVINDVQAVIQTVLGAIEAFWRTWGGTITNLVTGVFDGIRTYIQGVINVVEGIIRLVLDLIHGNWGKVWGDILQILTGIWDMIKGEVQVAIAMVGALIDAGMKVAADLMWRAWDGIKAVVSAALNDTVAFMAALPGRILGALGDLANLLLSAGMDLMQGLRVGISFVADQLWEWLKAFPFYVLDQIGNLGGILYDVGKAILQGLWDGMKAVWNDMTGWIGSIGGWIGNLKGPLEKDKVLLRPQGKAIIGGLHDGMKEGWGPVADWLSGRGSALSGNLGSAVRGGARGGAAAGIVVNVYNPQVQNPGDTQLLAANVGRQVAVALRGAA